MVDRRAGRQTLGASAANRLVPVPAGSPAGVRRQAALMDEPDFDPLATGLERSLERAKAWSAGSLALLLVGFVIGIHVLTGVALLALIVFAARWIQLGQRLREHESAMADDQRPASNIIQFRRPEEPPADT